MKNIPFASHFSALPIPGYNFLSRNVCIISSRGCTGALACHQNRGKALVYQGTMKPKKLSESKWMCVCVCFCQGELLLFYPWLWSCNRSSCPFSFIWLTAEPTLAETFFPFLTFLFTFFFKLHFSFFLSRDPSQQHAAPKCNLWFVWHCMSKSKRRGRKVSWLMCNLIMIFFHNPSQSVIQGKAK